MNTLRTRFGLMAMVAVCGAGQVLVGCSTEDPTDVDEEEVLEAEEELDLSSTAPPVLNHCPKQEDFSHPPAPLLWQIAAGNQGCDCVESSYDCEAPNPHRPTQSQIDHNDLANRARFLNPASVDAAWQVIPGVAVYDGQRQRIGTITTDKKLARATINFGQTKTMHQREYVYAVGLRTAVKEESVSGWIDSACVDWNRAYDPKPVADCESVTPQPYVSPMVAVDALRPTIMEENQEQTYRIRTTLPTWAKGNEQKIKVNCDIAEDAHQALGDYLPQTKSNGSITINLLFALPGMRTDPNKDLDEHKEHHLSGFSDDTFVVGHAKHGKIRSKRIKFHYLYNIPPVWVRLYQPKSDELYIHPYEQTAFVYGYVKEVATGRRRYGWLPAIALTP